MLTGVLTPDATRLVALPAAAGALRFGGMLDALRRMRAACVLEIDSESSRLRLQGVLKMAGQESQGCGGSGLRMMMSASCKRLHGQVVAVSFGEPAELFPDDQLAESRITDDRSSLSSTFHNSHAQPSHTSSLHHLTPPTTMNTVCTVIKQDLHTNR